MIDFPRFDEWFSLLEESFPKSEYRTYEGQKALLSNPCYRLYTVQQGERIVGLAAYWELASCRFIEHIAVDPTLRNAGVGAKLVRHITQSSTKPVFLEVEPLQDELTIRRINFYRRQGYHLNEFFYLQQPLRPGDKAQQLCIMSHGAPISEEKFVPYKKEIYFEVYKVNKI